MMISFHKGKIYPTLFVIKFQFTKKSKKSQNKQKDGEILLNFKLTSLVCLISALEFTANQLQGK